MSALTWGALGFLLLVLVAGPVGSAVVGLGTWRKMRGAARTAGIGLGDVVTELETLERRLASLERGGAELRAVTERLAVSLGRVRVLLAALQDVSAALDGVRVFLPRA